MLKNLVLSYYYSNININDIVMNFNEVCYSIKIKLSMRKMRWDTQYEMKKTKIDGR